MYQPSIPHLFADGSLGDALHHQTKKIRAHVDNVPERQFAGATDDELLDAVRAEFTFEPLQIDEAGRTLQKEEIQVDVRHDFDRVVWDKSKPAWVPGTRLTISVPFTGDPELWRLRPSTYRSSYPRGRIRGPSAESSGILEIILEQAADRAPEKFKQELDRAMEEIRFYIDNQNRELASNDATITPEIRQAISDRRMRLKKHDNLSELLGIPAVAAASPAAAAALLPSAPNSARTAPHSRKTHGTREWDVFISHASEDKESFARPLAVALQHRGLRVWFDEFTLVVGDSLRRSIDRGLAASEYGVVVISEHFLQKDWPQRELDGMVALELGGRKVILPVWHGVDAAKIRGHSPTLADRMATNSAKGLDKVVDELLAAIRHGSKRS